MVWIIFKTQVLAKVPSGIAAAILISPLLVLTLIFNHYKHLMSEEMVAVFYFSGILLLFVAVIWKLKSKSKQEESME